MYLRPRLCQHSQKFVEDTSRSEGRHGLLLWVVLGWPRQCSFLSFISLLYLLGRRADPQDVEGNSVLLPWALPPFLCRSYHPYPTVSATSIFPQVYSLEISEARKGLDLLLYQKHEIRSPGPAPPWTSGVSLSNHLPLWERALLIPYKAMEEARWDRGDNMALQVMWVLKMTTLKLHQWASGGHSGTGISS